MLTEAEKKRIKKHIEYAYECAKEGIAAARDCRRCGYTIGERAALTTVRIARKQIRERRLALKLNRRLTRVDISGIVSVKIAMKTGPANCDFCREGRLLGVDKQCPNCHRVGAYYGG